MPSRQPQPPHPMKITIKNAGHWSNPTGGRAIPVILIAPQPGQFSTLALGNAAAFTFGGDKRQRGRAVRRARAAFATA